MFWKDDFGASLRAFGSNDGNPLFARLLAGDVWEILPHGLQRHPAGPCLPSKGYDEGGQCVFVDDGRKTAWVERPENSIMNVKWLDVQTYRQLSDREMLDAASGSIRHHGSDYLLAASADGRYVITGNEDESDAKLYELPARRSLLFIAIASGAWTALAVIVPWWWRRRVSEKNPSSDLCMLSK
jgi:hypothetical protein